MGSSLGSFFKAVTGLLILAWPGFLLAQQSENEELFDLSPFVVVSNEDQGYRAISTLSGTRIRTNLSDLGSSITIITKELMDDLSATDNQTVLAYTGNTETGGILGNWGNGGDAREIRVNPDSTQRIRGLNPAEVTQDYFENIVQSDFYNVDRVSINRGPNSILYGMSSDAGIINQTTKKAELGGKFLELSLRVGHNGGRRLTFDSNVSYLNNRLALRIVGLSEHLKFRQKPTYEKDSRIYAAWKAILLENDNSRLLGRTILRGSIEYGDIDSSPPETTPPVDGFTSWFTGYRDPIKLLQVPGVTIKNLKSNGLTPQDVRDAVSAGLATVPPWMSSEEFAQEKGKFIPQTIVQRFTWQGMNNTPNTMSAFWSSNILLNYNSAAEGTMPGWDDPEMDGIEGMMLYWLDANPGHTEFKSAPLEGQLALFDDYVIQNRDILDYHNHYWRGHADTITNDFDKHRFVLEQILFNGNAGLEIVFNKQTRDLVTNREANSTIRVDITSHLPLGGINENAGRPFVNWRGNASSHYRNYFAEREDFRITAFGKLDLGDHMDGRLGKILGHHTITGIYENSDRYDLYRMNRMIWDAKTGERPVGSHLFPPWVNPFLQNWWRAVGARTYIGPSLLNVDMPSDVHLANGINHDFFEIGDTYRMLYFANDTLNSQVNDWFITTSLDADSHVERRAGDWYGATLLSHWLDSHLTSFIGWRNDQRDLFTGQAFNSWFPDPNIPDNIPQFESEGSYNPELLILSDKPVQSHEVSTHSWGLVAKYPKDFLPVPPFITSLSFHYFEGESSDPDLIHYTVLKEYIPYKRGETQEYGCTLALFNNRLSLRINNYETATKFERTYQTGYRVPVYKILGTIEGWLNNIITAQYGEEKALAETAAPQLGIKSYDEYYQRIIGIIPDNIQSLYNFRIVREGSPDPYVYVGRDDIVGAGYSSTSSQVAKGTEIDITGQITTNWNISLNIAQQETIRSNTAPSAAPVAFQIEQNIIDQGFANLPTGGNFDANSQTYLESYQSNVTAPIRSALAQDGRVSDEQREWRVNLVTRYDFREGILDGLSAGCALRWQDNIALGYPLLLNQDGNQVPNLDNPFMGPTELNGDLFIRYVRPIFDGKAIWSIQFNAKNLYRKNSDSDIPVSINPDGSLAIIRIPNERQFLLTNTIRF